MKQYEAVVQAVRDNGGYATLGQLYQAVLQIPDCKWGTKTPFASIRRIVQTHPQFFRIRPGLWGLTEMREEILRRLSLGEGASLEQRYEFDHGYYQGLAVELGNLQGYETFVPKQDMRRRFLSRTLSEVASLRELHRFSYDHVVKRAGTVDVVWFNVRNMPCAFFEVEHTTDIQNSLIKFLEFQDFRAKFCIVADTVRHAEFECKMGFDAFRPIRDVVQFVDYARLSEYHRTMSEAALLGRALRL